MLLIIIGLMQGGNCEKYVLLTENNNQLVPVLFKPMSFLKLAVHFFEMFLLLVILLSVKNMY